LTMLMKVNVPTVPKAGPSACHEHAPRSGHWTPLTELLIGRPKAFSKSKPFCLLPRGTISGQPAKRKTHLSLSCVECRVPSYVCPEPVLAK
jgi:hypothetical protein